MGSQVASAVPRPGISGDDSMLTIITQLILIAKSAADLQEPLANDIVSRAALNENWPERVDLYFGPCQCFLFAS